MLWGINYCDTVYYERPGSGDNSRAPLSLSLSLFLFVCEHNPYYSLVFVWQLSRPLLASISNIHSHDNIIVMWCLAVGLTDYSTLANNLDDIITFQNHFLSLPPSLPPSWSSPQCGGMVGYLWLPTFDYHVVCRRVWPFGEHLSCIRSVCGIILILQYITMISA